MSKFFNAIVIVLALNFLALAGAVGWLFQSNKLDKPKIAMIKDILFPPPAPAVPETQPAEEDPAKQKFVKLDELLAEKAGLPIGQQVEFIQQTFDAKVAELDRRQRELLALKDQIELAQRELNSGRQTLVKGEQTLTDREQEAAKLATDKGFQDAIKLYNTLPAKQVKSMFSSLDDDTVVRYLKAMEPRVATKTLKEFRTPDEIVRAQKLLERMRQAQPPATQAASIKE